MKKLILSILLLSLGFVNAQNAQALFNIANNHYQKEAYTSALQIYEDILEQNYESSELYYNIANVYYKTNKVAEAIYYYEKALLLNPNNMDAQENLILANQNTIDSIKELPKSVFQKFNQNVLAYFTYNTWAKISVVFCLVATLFWMIFFFTTQPVFKKMYFTFSILLTVFTVFSLSITFQQFSNVSNLKQAIVFSKRVEVKNAPRKSGNQVFILHLGTKVKILDVVGDWKKIKLIDGQVGWLPKKTIKEL